MANATGAQASLPATLAKRPSGDGLVESESFDIAEAAMLQARMPALQSHPPTAQTLL